DSAGSGRAFSDLDTGRADHGARRPCCHKWLHSLVFSVVFAAVESDQGIHGRNRTAFGRYDAARPGETAYLSRQSAKFELLSDQRGRPIDHGRPHWLASQIDARTGRTDATGNRLLLP